MRRLLPPARPDTGLLLLRIAVGVVLLFHGIFKLRAGVGWMAEPLGAAGLPAFLAYGVYLAEVVAPFFLIAGAWARIAAVVIALNMLMAILLVLRSRIFTINPQGGGWGIELEAMILFGALTIAIAGPGRYALVRDVGYLPPTSR